MNHARILLVDDDPDVIETLRFCLEKKGCEVITAMDGLKAMEMGTKGCSGSHPVGCDATGGYSPLINRMRGFCA